MSQPAFGTSLEALVAAFRKASSALALLNELSAATTANSLATELCEKGDAGAAAFIRAGTTKSGLAVKGELNQVLRALSHHQPSSPELNIIRSAIRERCPEMQL